MLVLFEEVKAFEEQLIECKRCKKKYPTNNFVNVSIKTKSTTCKYCRDDLRKEGEIRKIQQILHTR